MEQQIPIPPSPPPLPPKKNSRMKPCESQNMPFSYPWFEGGRGLNFPFILAKIVFHRADSLSGILELRLEIPTHKPTPY